MENRKYIILPLLLGPITAQSALTFDWNGYGTLGVTQFKNHQTFNGDSRLPYGEFKRSTSEKPDTKLALQGSAQFNDALSASVQVISRAKHDYEIDLEWAYLRYQLSNQLTLRAGRIKRHAYLQSDNYDISYSYNWIRPPTTTYLTIGPIYQALEAVDLYYQSSAENFDYSVQAYIGKAKDSADMFGVETDYEEHLAKGVTFLLETEKTEISLSHHRSNFDLEYPNAEELASALTTLGFPEIADNYDFFDQHAKVYALGLKRQFDTWDFTTEYIRSDFGEAQIPTLKGWYISSAKNFGNITLFASYGHQSTEVNQKLLQDVQTASQNAASSGNISGAVTSLALNSIADSVNAEMERQHIDRRSIQAGMRVEIHDAASFKIEYEKLKNRKTNGSASLYSVSIDFVF